MGIDERSGDQPPGDGRHGAPRGRAMPLARLASVLAALTVIGLAAAACVGPRALATGETARGFGLPAITNARERISLSQYAGKPVIINFFASWSPPCKAETKLLAHFYRFNHGRVLVVGVDSRDDRGAALRLMRSSLVAYPVAADPRLTVAMSYGVPGLPATYFLDARHQIVQTDLGWLSWKKLSAGVAAMDAGRLAG